MTNPLGERIEEAGVLVREGGGFALRSDRGGTLSLDLHRVPVDRIEKRVRIAGVTVDGGVIEVEAIGPA